jgi:hypothetical protein
MHSIYYSEMKYTFIYTHNTLCSDAAYWVYTKRPCSTELVSKVQGLQQDTEVEHKMSCLIVGASTFIVNPYTLKFLMSSSFNKYLIQTLQFHRYQLILPTFKLNVHKKLLFYNY